MTVQVKPDTVAACHVTLFVIKLVLFLRYVDEIPKNCHLNGSYQIVYSVLFVILHKVVQT